MIATPRTRLRWWRETDREAFAALNAHPEVVLDPGGPLGRVASDAELDRYAATFDRHGFCRWALERRDGTFLGCVGRMPAGPDHPLGAHFEVGWRLVRHAWGRGYATEAARAAPEDVFTRLGLREVLAYTAPEHPRSRAVPVRPGLRRNPSLDVAADYDGNETWRGLVWHARA